MSRSLDVKAHFLFLLPVSLFLFSQDTMCYSLDLYILTYRELLRRPSTSGVTLVLALPVPNR